MGAEKLAIRWVLRDAQPGLRVRLAGEEETFHEGDKVRRSSGKNTGEKTLFERAFNYTKTAELTCRWLNLLALLSIARALGARLAPLGFSQPDGEGAFPLGEVARVGFSKDADVEELDKVIRTHFQKGEREVIRIAKSHTPWTISLAIPPGDIAFDDGVIDALCARLGGGDGDLDDALRSYLAALEEDIGSIDIRGLGRGIQTLQADITDLYTPLLTRAPGGDLLGQSEGRPELVNLADMLPAHAQLLIEGPAGSGKTTFHQLVACTLARDLLARPVEGAAAWREKHLGLSVAEHPWVPLFVRLAAMIEVLTGPGVVPADPKAILLAALSLRAEELGVAVSPETWRRIVSDRRTVLLLDGLDEVTDEGLRERLFEMLKRIRKDWPLARVIVTSRPFDTGRLRSLGFAAARVEPLGGEGIRNFIGRWVASFARPPRRYRETLEQALFGNPIICELAESPMMLTCLCVLHWNDNDLPHGRAGVYERVLEWLLKRRAQQRKDQRYPQAFAEYAFPALAFAMMTAKGGKKVVIDVADAADVVKREATDRYRKDFGDGPEAAEVLRRWLRWECLWSGVIEEVGRGSVRFRHLTFQEYYAATQLARLPPDPEPNAIDKGAWWPIVEPHLEDAQWRETVDMFPVCLLANGQDRVDVLIDRVLGPEGAERGLAEDARAVGVGGRMLAHLGVPAYDYRPTSAIEERYRRAVERVMPIFEKDPAAKVGWKERLAVAEALGRSGDPRLSTPPRERMRPVHGHPGVELGVYPVTVEEYRHFVDQRRYDVQRYWVGEGREDGWEVKLKEKWLEPERWKEQLRTPSRPVVGVSWYEASAYCAWLAEQTGERFGLPTEDEWTSAATPEKGEYPWGEPEPTPERANYGESDLGAPSPVGIYPAGAARAGHLDMAGNVWEWCLDPWTDDGRPEQVDAESLRGAPRVVRGGSWIDWSRSLRCAIRSWRRPGDRLRYLGFRVVCRGSRQH